jgi:hypothetical protein
MAEGKTKPRGTGKARDDGRNRDNGTGRDGDGDRPRRRKRASAAKAAAAAKNEIAELMGRAPEAVSGVERDDDGWLVTVEFVELERIPQSTDVMATYEVSLDDGGELTGYRRTKRYVRSQAEG